jgi:hypothetical protein
MTFAEAQKRTLHYIKRTGENQEKVPHNMQESIVFTAQDAV